MLSKYKFKGYARISGAVHRRHLNFQKILGKGTMHSKFIVSDKRSFYLGSANLDWRSLNQKMELGVIVKECPCLAEDLSNVFDTYWELSSDGTATLDSVHRVNQREASYNMRSPLRVIHKGAPTDVFIATSPPLLNGPRRTWDLEAILRAINDSKAYLYIHVMDYFPMFVYSKPRRYWPVIDDAIRKAVFRGVEVKMLVAALHYPALGLRFLSSLESLSGINTNGSIEARIFKVPTPAAMQTVMVRERRTHNKFVVTDDTIIIGTSNWSGDYFDGGSTGAAFVAQQHGAGEEGRPLVAEMKGIFLRDWYSEYTHSVSEYTEKCLLTRTGAFCEADKDPALLATSQQ
uniref:Phospholipase D3 n=1 Tax=Ascaris suum TaxID=6253 RepID=F1KU68_ASCSU